MNILVTGGAGFIGSNLIDKLLIEGNKVICFDNFDPFYKRSTKILNLLEASRNNNFILFEGDIRNKSDLENCFRLKEIDLVIHLAAKAGVLPSISDPMGYFETNLIGTLNILESMRLFKVNKMIFASSSSIYGNTKSVPFTESDKTDLPISPYAASKKAAELLCYNYHHLYGIDIFCLRFFTVYGQRQRPDLAIYKFTKALLEEMEIPFYGDGTTCRDYTHISDIIKGIEGAIKNLKGFDVFNLGESRTTSLSLLITLIEKYTNKTAKKLHLPLQAGDVAMTYANIEKARFYLNYNPTIDLEDGLKDFVKWYKANA